MIKPKICHLVDGYDMGWTGGINATLHSLETSYLSEKFAFIAAPLSSASSIISQEHPHVIVVHAASSWQGLFPLWKISRSAKLIIYDHHYTQGFETCNVPSISRFHLMLKLAYGLCDCILSVSHGQQHWMLKNQLAPPEKINVIKFSRPLDAFLNVAPKPRLSHQPFILGTYGRLVFQKGFDILIDTVKQLPHLQLKLKIGGLGKDEAKLKQLAVSCPQIEFMGRIDDTPSFLSQCDGFVIPSRWEPWGTVCLEAKAAGKPVIASEIDGLSEQIQGFGFLIPPGNSVALAESIQELVNLSATELENKGQQGKASAIDSWQIYLSKWEKLLEELT